MFCLLVCLIQETIALFYIFRPFFLDRVFVIVIEPAQYIANDTFSDDLLNFYPFGDPSVFILSFGDMSDRDRILAQEPEHMYQEMLRSQCSCSKTMALSLIYLDIFLGGDSETIPECLNFQIHQKAKNEINISQMEVNGQDIVRKLLQTQEHSSKSNFLNFYFIPIGFSQNLLIQEFDSHNFIDDDVPVTLSLISHADIPGCLYPAAQVTEKLHLDFLFSVYYLPQCPYPEEYCCFLQRHQFGDIAWNSRCTYHPAWALSTTSEREPSPQTLSSQTLSSQTLINLVSDEDYYSSSDDLDISLTGKFFYLEEKLQAMVRDGKGNSSLAGRHQHGLIDTHNFSCVSVSVLESVPAVISQVSLDEVKIKVTEEVIDTACCCFFPAVGMSEFIDFGPDPIPSFRNQYIHEVAPSEVSTQQHFILHCALTDWVEFF
jgi:hypothetical protein